MMSIRSKKPEIRFAGFEDEWVKKKFNDVFDMLSNNTLSRDALNSENGIAKNIHYGDVLTKFSEYIDVSSTKLPFISDPSIAVKFIRSYLKDGDIVIADTAEDETVGKCTEVIGVEEMPIIAGLHTMPCRPKEKYAPKYMGYYLNSNAYHDNLFPLMQGVKVTSISRTGIKETDVILSTEFDEQEKISKYLSSLDEMIALETAKYEKLVIIKKAMLDKMFPKEGCDVPELRFDGFTDDWVKCTLNDIGIIQTGNTPSTVVPEYYSNNGLLWVTPTDITGGVLLDTAKKLSTKGIKVARVIPPDSILCTCIASIGKNAYLPVRCAFNQQINALVPNKEKHNPYFLYTDSYHWSQVMKKSAGGLTFQIVNKTEFSVIETITPDDLEEERKIGDLFYKLDNLIALQQQKVEKLKNIKSACMEKMFV